MFPDLDILTTALRAARARLAALRRGDAGYTTEAVIATAVLAALALTVLGVVTAKVVAKATSISL
jgi:hypothetical protein